MVRLRAGLDGDGVAAKIVRAKLLIDVVAGGVEVLRDALRGEMLAGADFSRGGVDLRDRSEEWTGGEAVIDDLLVVVVVVAEDGSAHQHADEHAKQEEADEAGEEAALRSSDSESYRHGAGVR